MGYEEATYAVSEIVNAARRDQISGLPPMPMKRLVVENSMGSVKTIINFTPPDDTVLNDQIVAYIKGVLILRKEGTEEAQNKDDGVVVLDAVRDLRTRWSQYENWEDTDVVAGTTYTYTAFAYTDHLVYDYKGGIARTITAKNVQAVVYGFHQDFDDLDPATSITYDWEGDIYDVRNRMYKPARTNECEVGLGNQSIGSWEHFLSEELNNHPFALNIKTGAVVGQLKENQYNYLIDDTEVTYEDDGTTNVFAWMNKIYIKEIYASDGKSRDVYFTFDSTFAHENGFFAQGFMDDDTELEGMWIPTYESYGYAYTNTDFCKRVTATKNTETGILEIASDSDDDKYINNLSKPKCANYVYANRVMRGTPKHDGPHLTVSNYDDIGFVLDYMESKFRDTTSHTGRLRLVGGSIINTIRDMLWMIYESPDLYKYASHGYMSNAAASDKGHYMVQLGNSYGAHVNLWDLTDVHYRGVCGFKGSDYHVSGTTTVQRFFHSFVLGESLCWWFNPYLMIDKGEFRYMTNYNSFGYKQNIRQNPNYKYNSNSGGYKTVLSTTGPVAMAERNAYKMIYVGDGYGSIPDINTEVVVTNDEGITEKVSYSQYVDTQTYPTTSTIHMTMLGVATDSHTAHNRCEIQAQYTLPGSGKGAGIGSIGVLCGLYSSGNDAYNVSVIQNHYLGKIWNSDGTPYNGAESTTSAHSVIPGYGSSLLLLPAVGFSPYDD